MKLTKIQRLIDSIIEPVLIIGTIPVIILAVELIFLWQNWEYLLFY